MNIDDLTVKQAREIAALFSGHAAVSPTLKNGLIGKYVIVRCHDAGVHAGVLVSHKNRECVLEKARRLWYWKPAKKASFLSGVATEGLHDDSKIGAPIHIHLTEICEIIECLEAAEQSIRAAKSYEQG